jgi:hypothetical protein
MSQTVLVVDDRPDARYVLAAYSGRPATTSEKPPRDGTGCGSSGCGLIRSFSISPCLHRPPRRLRHAEALRREQGIVAHEGAPPLAVCDVGERQPYSIA